jgi:hypothetical protein
MMIEITGTAAIRRNFMAPHICMLRSPVLGFLALCFARGTNHGDSALGSAQGSIHRWLMAIIFEREEAVPEKGPPLETQRIPL